MFGVMYVLSLVPRLPRDKKYGRGEPGTLSHEMPWHRRMSTSRSISSVRKCSHHSRAVAAVVLKHGTESSSILGGKFLSPDSLHGISKLHFVTAPLLYCQES